ncbi:MAG TPA: exosortase/archaeosortase family protein [Opitutaceae bacterium]|nr:exosortase/archaeosortase family protein [Opitutaceae bacterium]
MPLRLLAALGVGLAYVVFLTIDQSHWWRLKPDYAFGWLVPVFVVFLVSERWPRLQEIARSAGSSRLPGWLKNIVWFAAAAALAGGLLLFVLGAIYRAGAGSTQPGSLILACGHAGVLLGMIYFNVPPGSLADSTHSSPWQALRYDAQLRAVALFVFPAFIWILSAPLLTAVENAISIALLQKVVATVFAVFSMLGFPLVQEGNVLVLPLGTVGVAEACSGIRSLTGCLFAGSFLAAICFNRLWQKFALVAAALGLAYFTNLLRSLFLTAWAYAYGSEAIEGSLHDLTGYAVLGLTVLLLLLLMPLLNPERWRRWLKLDEVSTRDEISAEAKIVDDSFHEGTVAEARRKDGAA